MSRTFYEHEVHEKGKVIENSWSSDMIARWQSNTQCDSHAW